MRVIATVEVRETERELETSQPAPFQAGTQEVLTSAGTYGDLSRFLQMFPGVVANDDTSNDFLVRGGHPIENLFLVDGIEVPNINHLATSGTTGGFAPMIDAGVVQSIKLHTGGYEAQYPERLSSVTEIQSLDPTNFTQHVEGDFGIEGFGGLTDRRLYGGDLLVSAHRGLLNLISGDIGLNGVPSYTNELSRFRRRDASGNGLTLLNVVGQDTIKVTPCASDQAETSTVNTQYSGWRETTGGEWQRVLSANSFAVASISDSEQVEHIHQQEQIIDPTKVTLIKGVCPIPAGIVQTMPVYMEDTNNGFSTASFRYEWSKSRIGVTAGSAFWLQRPDFEVEQPEGAFTPYSVAPKRTDVDSFESHFSTGESGSYAQITVHPGRVLVLSAGGRLQTFAFHNHLTVTPRLSVSYPLSESVRIHLAFASYAQMPPYVYLVAYPENRSLLPMRASHELVGMDFSIAPSSEIHVEAYNKQYKDIPASLEYPSVTLHSLVEMLGQQFVWLPMNSDGRGGSSGLELSDTTRFGSRFLFRGAIAYSRAKFAGTDGILRPSNFDFPWIVNLAANERLGHGFEISARNGFATGRPYTPYDLRASLAQNRPIFDVTKINAKRAPYYGRLDFQIIKSVAIKSFHLELYGGVDNVLNRSNFLAYAWMPRNSIFSKERDPVAELHQVPIFPNFGVRLVLR